MIFQQRKREAISIKIFFGAELIRYSSHEAHFKLYCIFFMFVSVLYPSFKDVLNVYNRKLPYMMRLNIYRVNLHEKRNVTFQYL